MKILFYDTETTGLITKNNFPYIVQFSYIIYDTELNSVVFKYDEIIHLPDTIEIPEESTKIHHISTLMSKQSTVEILDCLKEFVEQCKNVELVVGHNISFDKRMIMVECIRNQLRQQFTVNGVRMSECCTMRHFTEVCNLHRVSKNGHSYLKFPTLSETYNHLFRTQPKNTHDAMADVIICLRCYVYGLHSGQDISKEACRSLKELFTLYCL